MEASAKQHIKSITVDAVIIRKDGGREDLGTIAQWHRNPFVRLWRRYARGIRGKARGPEDEIKVLTRTAFDRFVFRLKWRIKSIFHRS